MSVAERIKEARGRAGLSQRDLADKAGLSNAYVNQVEASIDASPDAVDGIIRSPSVESLGKLAAALGVRVEWLAFGTGDVTSVDADEAGDAA